MIYILTLLVPLHQAAGLQHELAHLGFETIGSPICALHTHDHDGGDEPGSAECAVGISKQEFTASEPASLHIIIRILELVRYAVEARLDSLSIHDHSGQARAPPVTV